MTIYPDPICHECGKPANECGDCREAKIQHLCEVARRCLCYLPRAYDTDGPHGELEQAIKEVEK